MEKARELIKVDGNLSIKQVSSYVGYKDISYFYRVFKKYYDVSPGQMK